MPLLAVMSDLDLIESPSADQARTCLKLVFAASHTMIFERLPRKMYLCNAKAVVHSCCIFAKECLKVYSRLLSRHSLSGRYTALWNVLVLFDPFEAQVHLTNFSQAQIYGLRYCRVFTAILTSKRH